MLTASYAGAICFLAVAVTYSLRDRTTKMKAPNTSSETAKTVQTKMRTSGKKQSKLGQPESQSQAPASIYPMRSIGRVSSVFRLCVGTPRQGLLTPAARGVIHLDQTFISPEAVKGLSEFTHIWVLFIFHLNSNTAQQKRTMESTSPSPYIFPSKISPPALGGKKVGVLSTRTPHRPNPIGFTLCRLDRIELPSRHSKTTKLWVSALDLVEGTPVVDIKPYVPHYDAVVEAKVPGWIDKGLELRRPVEFEDNALDIIDKDTKLEFYKGADLREQAKEVITQVLAADVRSKWQTSKVRKGGQVQPVVTSKGNRVEGETTSTFTSTSTQQIDNMVVHYRVERREAAEDEMTEGSGATDVVVITSVDLVKC